MVNRSLPIYLFVVATASALAQSPAPTACPWLTKGSAEKGLGGEASLSIHLGEGGEGSCTFTRSPEPAAFLKVEVSKAALAACPEDSAKLKGIGNEALRCRISGATDGTAEMISSRVRDMHFTITLNFRGKSDSANAPDTQDDALEHIAETVAGNLF